MLNKLSEKALTSEAAINQELFNALSAGESFLFDAGAGAGKTYSLVECLKHIIATQEPTFTVTSQKVACITYTNVTANEIQKRLGESDIVLATTIHDFMWSFISCFQKELVDIHIEKLKRTINELETKLNHSDKCIDPGKYCDSFRQTIVTNRTSYLDIHYGAPDASSFKDRIANEIGGAAADADLFKSNAKYKATAKAFIDIDNMEKCLSAIKDGNKEYNSVSYDPMRNTDQLHKMKISHDTVLEYSREMLYAHEGVRRLFIDLYPIMFVDEYQDTDKNIVEAINIVLQYAKKQNLPFLVGFYGDQAQRIYGEDDAAVEEVLNMVDNHNIKRIIKEHNRRSCQEIIEVANAIRNDDVKQTSIYDDCSGGQAKFYSAKRDIPEHEIIEQAKGALGCDDDDLGILLVANRSIAKQAGFEELFQTLDISGYYKAHWDQIGSELMSKNTEKLGASEILLFRLIEFGRNVRDRNTPISYFITKEGLRNTSVAELSQLFNILSSPDCNTLRDYLEKLFSSVEGSLDTLTRDRVAKMIENKIGLDEASINAVENALKDALFYYEEENKKTPSLDETVNALLDLNLEVYDAWFDFLTRSDDANMHYHTFHGTKGDEFDNVIAVGSNKYSLSSCGRRTYFDDFFENYNTKKYDSSLGMSSTTDAKERERFQKARNLLYVAATRAKKNFALVYLDDISPFKEQIEQIFGEIHYLA